MGIGKRMHDGSLGIHVGPSPKKRAIGFNAGQFGDVVMGTVAARAHKREFPDSHLTVGIAEKYSAIHSLFATHEYFDDVHIWKGYNDWPNSDDNLHLAMNRYDKVYNAMPQHTEAFWYLHRHQTAELCLMHGLTPPDNLQISLKQNWEKKNFGFIGFSLFGETRGGHKSVGVEQAKNIVEMVKKMGGLTVQFGLAEEPEIGCDSRFIGSFEDTVKNLTYCKALVTVDTAMSWIASGYSIPTIGLYGYEYYPLARTSVNWQPVNPNAIYIESPKVSDIIIDRIEAAIKSLKL